jgi:muconolactone D-isomerase
MAMFLVRMNLKLDPDFLPAYVEKLYANEAKAAEPYLASGQMARVFRVPGTRNHVALWDVADAQMIHDAYTSFPMFPWMTVSVEPLCVSPNDPGNPATDHPDLKMTWRDLNAYYTAHLTGQPVTSPERQEHGEGETVMLTDTVSIHKHPHSDEPEEFHFMAGNVKVAEIGPDTNEHHEMKAPGYVSFVAEWESAPIGFYRWKARIAADNKVLHPDYDTALAAPRARF